MRAARFYAHHDVRIEDIPVPEPKPDEVLVEIAWGGMCGTDLYTSFNPYIKLIC